MKSKNIQYQEKIDHLRFFAAFLILVFHGIFTHFLWKPIGAEHFKGSPLLDVLWEGHTAVGLFMTLSGFLFAVICKGKEVNALGFYRNRFLRIYPLFFTFVFLACYLDQTRNGFISLLTSLSFLQNMESAVFYKWFTEVFWTIAVEFQFYLLFPFILVFFRKYGYKYLFGLIALSILILFAVYIAQGTVKTLSYLTIFGRINEFIIGMIFGFMFDSLRRKLAHPACLPLAMVSVMLAASHFHAFGGLVASVNSYVWIYWPTLEGLVWGFLIVAYNASNLRIPQPFSRWLALAGTLSFSMYMSHYFFLRTSMWYVLCLSSADQHSGWLGVVLEQLRIHPLTGGLVFGLCVVFPLTLLASILTYSLIEKPFLELRSTYTRRPDPDREEPAKPLQERVPVSV
jgi:peptidoglycan/LPS O-acetylase OafA/YrhL